MAIGWGPRLVALLFLLFFQIISIASDIVFFRSKKDLFITDSNDQSAEPAVQTCNTSQGTSLTGKAKRLFEKPDISRCLLPLLLTTLSAAIVSILFSGASGTSGATGRACSTKPDADISGVGVRASIWGQIGMLILIIGCGYFHKKETAIKEVAGGLILTHVSLAIAIIVQMYKRTLTSVDAAIGAAILDAQNIALHIPVTAKQTLAARWQVLILIPTQILGLVFLPVLVVKFIKGSFASEDCKCFSVFWWSRLSDCDAFPGSEISLFWIYYSLRWIMWAQSTFHSMYNAEWFHRSEKEGRISLSNEHGSENDSDEATAHEKQQHPERVVEKATIQAGLLYKEYPATVSASNLMCALHSVTSMAVAETAIRGYGLQPISQVNSIGQIIAMVIALATFIRVLWSFQSLYNKAKNKSFPDLIFNPRESWIIWSCCTGSRPNKESKDLSSTSRNKKTATNQSASGSPNGSDNSGRPRTPGPPALPSSSRHEASGRFERYPKPHDEPRSQGENRQPLDSTSAPQTQQFSISEPGGRTQRLPPIQLEPQPQRSHAYEPVYRYEFQQPFHLDAVKQLFLPTFTRYLEDRKEAKVAVLMSKTMASAPIQPQIIDQPTACTSHEQSQQDTGKERVPPPLIMHPTVDRPIADTPSHLSQQNTGKEEARPPRSVAETTHPAEASTFDDDEHPVMARQFSGQKFGLPERASGSSQGSEPFQYVQHTNSWEDSSPIIDQFVAGYSKEREYWKACADRARELIEEKLVNIKDANKEVVFAKVTSRAKEVRSVLDKVKLRNWQRQEEDGKRPYLSVDEIYDDLVDLAGVRVVLYTPNQAQREKVREILSEIWGPSIHEKQHDDSRPVKKKDGSRNTYVQRHLGYQADHYLTPMPEKYTTRDGYQHSEGDRVEIQVVSALGHAWAEAGHEVLHKTQAYGRPSIMEQQILDALNGLIVSGDLLLEQFRESVAKRTVERWNHFDQFENFLRECDLLERNDTDNNTSSTWKHFSTEAARVLFRFLRKVDKNYGLAVRDELKDLQYPLSPEPTLQARRRKFRPTIPIHPHLLTTICIIDHLLPQRQRAENVNNARQCRIMIDAFILLQTFAGDPETARTHLNDARVERTDDETIGLNVVLTDSQRDRCLAGEDVSFLGAKLQSAWAWFEKQAANPRSICGLFFRLAELDVPAHDLDDAGRVNLLKIGDLIRVR